MFGLFKRLYRFLFRKRPVKFGDIGPQTQLVLDDFALSLSKLGDVGLASTTMTANVTTRSMLLAKSDIDNLCDTLSQVYKEAEPEIHGYKLPADYYDVDFSVELAYYTLKEYCKLGFDYKSAEYLSGPAWYIELYFYY